jgi:hypothetical protein
MLEKSPASNNATSRDIAHRITEEIKQASGVEFTSQQQDAIEALLSSKFAAVAELVEIARELVFEGREIQSEFLRRQSELLQSVRNLRVSGTKLLAFVTDNDKWRAAHARSGRSKTLREQTINQGIAKKTKDWDGKHHFKKAQEIHGAINALLEEAGTARGITVEALSRRLKTLQKIDPPRRSD